MMLQERQRIAQQNRANWFNNRKRPKQNSKFGNSPYSGGGFGPDYGGQSPYGESQGYGFGPGFGEYGYEGFGPEGYYGRDFYYDYGPGFDRYGYDGFGPDGYYGYEYDEFYR